MSWFNVDDGFADHPKVVRLQGQKGWQSAIALWTLAGSWAAKHLTDGLVPAAIVTRFGCTPRDADMLVEAGLWERTDDGYAFHDWTARNPSRAQVEAKREKNARKVSNWRSNQTRNQVTDQVADDGTNQGSNPAPLHSSPLPSQDPPNPHAAEPPKKPHPLRLKPVLEECVRAEFGKRSVPRQGASPSQWEEACKRVDDALALRSFRDAQEACEALAKAAVAEALKPGGKLGFALGQATFVAAAPPVVDLASLRPSVRHRWGET